LVFDGERLAVESSLNQDSPLMAGKIPLAGIDVWEHAYYLRYQNRRAQYVDAVIDNLHWGVIAHQLPS
jgi:Fe-Mn family superoxide dismutase